ncbi:TIGR02147 family protein [Bdellovibrio sp. HCB337]|uniref:TIGR02147 family protein n=1 Tax=Bdellovibrio sp. HCB337 TaxID=3394358 RepID=UPI0039A76924
MQGTQLEFEKSTNNSATSIPAPHVSDYMDYRKYLAGFLEYKRKLTASDIRPYSYATFSAAANIKSPNYLKMIIEGRRNLSDEMVLKFAKALGMNKEATEDFELLVGYGQSTDPADRNMFLKKLSEHRVQVKLKSGEIDRKTWEKIPNWAAWVIYAMVDQEGVKFDVKSLKEILRGKASEDEIEQALQSLFNSGELVQDPETGAVRKAHTLIESAEDVPVALVRKLQAQLMYLGLESLYQDSATEREFGTLTLSLTKQEFEEIKFKLRQMRKQINKDNSIARTSSKGEKVYQLNIQLFPVTNATPEAVSADKNSSEGTSH